MVSVNKKVHMVLKCMYDGIYIAIYFSQENRDTFELA